VRRSLVVSVGVLVMAAVLLPVSATASTTWHGKFVSAYGLNTNLPGVQVPFKTSGTWNVVDPGRGQGTPKITGVLTRESPSCPEPYYPPAEFEGGMKAVYPFTLPLLNVHGAAWSNGVLTAHGFLGPVSDPVFVSTFILDPAAAVPVTVVVIWLAPCPYGWESLVWNGTIGN